MSGLYGLNGGAAGTDNAQSNAFISPDLAGMLGSNSIVNDTCFRSDNNKIYTLLDEPANIENNWKMHPSDAASNTYDIASGDYELGNGENPQNIFNGSFAVVNFNRFKNSTACIFYPVQSKFQILEAGFYSVDATANLRSYSAVLTTGGENILALKKDSQASSMTVVLAEFFDSILFGSAVIEERKTSASMTKTVYLDAGDFVYLELSHTNNVSSGFCEVLNKSLKITKIFGLV